MSREPTQKLLDASIVLPIVRGALAEASEDPDDPFLRVILLAESETGSGATLDAGSVPAAGSEEGARDAMASLLAAEPAARRMDRVALGSLGSFRVVREPRGDALSLKGKVAIVTGAGGAIGGGLCRGLLARGCRVAAADVSPEALDGLLAEHPSEASEGRLVGVHTDVTLAESVAEAFAETARTWGGADIVVVNAGIAMVSPLVEMDTERFHRLEKVNIDGTLFTLAEAGRVLCRQGTGGDIVLISTKNVFSPGAQFGAYSATKAAAHQLARIASLELAPYDVRVNMVSPDAVFADGVRRSGLWKEIGPSRMQARGLEEGELEEYYRQRNLLKATVTPDHVANAVLFFVTRQTPTTGATLPVDGGLPDATPR